jgi:hypothetical protein
MLDCFGDDNTKAFRLSKTERAIPASAVEGRDGPRPEAKKIMSRRECSGNIVTGARRRAAGGAGEAPRLSL